MLYCRYFKHFKARSSARYVQNFSVLSSPTDLNVKCSCGKQVLCAKGTSWVNYICHNSSTRDITKDPFSHMTSFKSNQVVWSSDAYYVKRRGSDNSMTHILCACEKRQLLANDYTDTLGVVSINVEHSPERCSHAPNHHFFYDQRVMDIHDSVPKWKTIIGSEPIPTPSSSSSNSHIETSSITVDSAIFQPLEPLEPKQYHFTECEVPANHITNISEAKIDERRKKKYVPPTNAYIKPSKQQYDAIIVGGGHNGLVTAAYLAKSGIKPLVLERRHVIGGAAVTEEMIPGFHFSRASYLAGLLRPQVITDLQLEKYGFKYLPRNPSSFTPTKLDSIHQGKYLMFQEDEAANYESIAQFSRRDAENFPKYEQFLNQIRDIMQPLLDGPPPDLSEGKWGEKLNTMKQLEKLVSVGIQNRQVIVPFYELFTAPAQQILDRWFESDILKTTLATDAVIGALIGPKQNGSAYVLLHHVMGEAAGRKGVWAYVEGGMGSISRCIGEAAKEHGTEIALNAVVKRILVENNRVKGVEMEDGSHIYSDVVISGTTPYHTFIELMPEWTRSQDTTSPISKFTEHIRHTDYSCGAFKINCAVNELPNFTCYPSPAGGQVGPMHRGTVHFESQMEEIELAYREAMLGRPATRPVIEMTIPTSVDRTIAPPGKHIVQLFVQYAPYDLHPKVGSWADPKFKDAFVQRCIRIVDEFCPNFSSSIIGIDALSPLDLERTFGLHKGSISHGALGLNQLGYARPMPGYSSHRTPVPGLYLCSAGTHPGGGVIGAGGHNCSKVVISDRNRF